MGPSKVQRAHRDALSILCKEINDYWGGTHLAGYCWLINAYEQAPTDRLKELYRDAVDRDFQDLVKWLRPKRSPEWIKEAIGDYYYLDIPDDERRYPKNEVGEWRKFGDPRSRVKQLVSGMTGIPVAALHLDGG